MCKCMHNECLNRGLKITDNYQLMFVTIVHSDYLSNYPNSNYITKEV